MSLGDSGSGQYAPYVPPPPPAAKRSPWMYIALGCGLALILGFGGCAAIIGLGVSKIKSEMAKPVNEAEINAALKDTPRYPGATFDALTTKAGRAGLSAVKMMIPSTTAEVGGYRTADDSGKVLDWYDKKMEEAGYQEQDSPNAAQHQYKKGDKGNQTIVIVQAQKSRRRTKEADTDSETGGAKADTGKGGTMILLMRFDGVHGKM